MADETTINGVTIQEEDRLTLVAQLTGQEQKPQSEEQNQDQNNSAPAGTGNDDAFNQMKSWFEFGDDVKTKEDAINTVKSWKEKNTTFSAEVNAGTDIDPDLLKQDAFFKTTGVKDYSLYQRVMGGDLTQMNPVDKILLKRELDYVATTGSAMPPHMSAALSEKLQRQYLQHTVDENDDPIDPKEKSLAEYQLTTDAAAAEKELREKIAKVSETVPTTEPIAQQVERLSKAWEPFVKSAFDNKTASKVSFELKGEEFKNILEDGKESFPLAYDVPLDDYNKYLREFYGTVIKQRIDMDAEKAPLALTKYVQDRAFSEHGDKIISLAVKLAVEAAQKRFVAENSGIIPALGDKNTRNTTQVSPLSPAQQLRQAWDAQNNKN